MSRKLIAYFSPGIGETAETAKNLAEILRADLYEIKALEPYTKEDLDWEHPYSRNVLENADKFCRPAIAGDLPDLTDYDTVFLGFPIWWIPRRKSFLLSRNPSISKARQSFPSRHPKEAVWVPAPRISVKRSSVMPL